MIHIQAFTFNPFSENTYILYDDSRDAVIVDPGCYERSEQEELANFISEQKLSIRLLLNTHCHIDHVLGNEFVKRSYGVPFLIHPIELPVLKSVKAYAPNYGFPNYHEILPDGELRDGASVSFGNSSMQVIFLPGHSPGHVGFYEAKQKFLICGDVLFYHSVGRTDLPGGNSETLLTSIQQKLFLLPDDVTVYAGHGPTTTLGEEKIHNPYCALTV